MSELAQNFVQHLQKLAAHDRGALAILRRGASFAPGAYPPAYPYVERFVPDGRHARDSLRQALYLTATLFANHPVQDQRMSFAAAFGALMRERESDSIEKRFISLLSSDSEQVSNYLRQATSLLAADSIGVNYVLLLDDLQRWLNPFRVEARDEMRQRWARDFYRALNAAPKDEAASE